ncbi:MAG: hypothetical protein C0602_12595 [Denitrovibrio sp.]|nr:MAG: hypothetical protein C0602_12595 [Denitrovibrio sp.]
MVWINRSSRAAAYFMILLLLTCGIFAYSYKLALPSAEDIIIRQAFTKLTGLSDISVYTESPSERYRTLTDIGSVFSVDPFAPDTDFSAIIYKKVEHPK